MVDRHTLRACPYCGSLETYPALLFGGPLPWVDHNDGGYQCRNCGRTAVPLDFDSLNDLEVFKRSLGTDKKDEADDFLHIPILPVDTTALFRVPVIDLPIAQVAEVVEVQWDQRYGIVGRRGRFDRYWHAIHSPRYSARQIMLLDLSGVNLARPNFDVLKTLIKTKYQVWLDLGVRDIEDVFDCFAMDVARTVIGTMTSPSLDVFTEAFDLSDRVVPCVQWDGHVRWPRRGSGPDRLMECIDALVDIGYERIGVLDLRMIGRRKGIDHQLLDSLEEVEANILFGGGVTEQEVPLLRTAGMAGVFIDPFTPVIEELVDTERDEVPTDKVAPTTRPASRGLGLASE